MRKPTKHRTSPRSNRDARPAGSTEESTPENPPALSQRRPQGRPRPRARRSFRLSSGWVYAAVGAPIIAVIVGLVVYSNVQQKVALEGIKTPVLPDPGLVVSKSYSANQSGMMGAGADGHSFIVVGPDGTIKWRADYGGAPKYTMYVPVEKLAADMRQGMKQR